MPLAATAHLVRNRIARLLIAAEPPVPDAVLGSLADRFAALPRGGAVCIKVSAARRLPYPFRVSVGFVSRVVEEIHAANSSLRIVITEGGVEEEPVLDVARDSGLASIPGAEFVDAEAGECVWAPSGSRACGAAAGFWLPEIWVHADERVNLTTCKVRSHHFRRWFSGGIRNLIGLLPRERYRLPARKRNLRSELHRGGLDLRAADLYETAGRGVLTVLDGRLIARNDEHLPLRFTLRKSVVIVRDDPREADIAMAAAIGLPFLPPYLAILQDRDEAKARG